MASETLAFLDAILSLASVLSDEGLSTQPVVVADSISVVPLGASTETDSQPLIADLSLGNQGVLDARLEINQ